MANVNFLDMNSILSFSEMESAFNTCLSSYSNLTDVPKRIIANYQTWLGIELTDEQFSTKATTKAHCQSIVYSWIAWLQLNAQELDERISLYKAVTGEESQLSKFIDTPETEADYSGDSHTTTVTKNTRTVDSNAAKMELLKPWIKDFVERFRKTWLMPKEAI